MAPHLTHVWRWRQTRYGPLQPEVAARVGHACRVFARGHDGKVGVQFADGFRVVAPRWAIRAIPADAETGRSAKDRPVP